MLTIPLLPIRGGCSIIASKDDRPITGLFATMMIELPESRYPRMLHSCRIDTGACCSGWSRRRADKLGLLRADDMEVELSTRTASGAVELRRVRIGIRQMRIPQLRDEPFRWPVAFHPDWSEDAPFLLGLLGVIEDIRLNFDGTPGESFDYGRVTLSLRESGS